MTATLDRVHIRGRQIFLTLNADAKSSRFDSTKIKFFGGVPKKWALLVVKGSQGTQKTHSTMSDVLLPHRPFFDFRFFSYKNEVFIRKHCDLFKYFQ